MYYMVCCKFTSRPSVDRATEGTKTHNFSDGLKSYGMVVWQPHC